VQRKNNKQNALCASSFYTRYSLSPLLILVTHIPCSACTHAHTSTDQGKSKATSNSIVATEGSCWPSKHRGILALVRFWVELSLHLQESIFNRGPSFHFSFFFWKVKWSFQKNWVKPEVEIIKKLLNYQNLLRSDILSALPPQLKDFKLGNTVHIYDGSVE